MGENEIRRATEILRGLRIGINKNEALTERMQDEIEKLKTEISEW
jgi:hypothetical protein